MSTRLSPVRTLLFSLAVFFLLALVIAFAAFMVLVEPGPEGRVAYLETGVRLLLHRHGLVDSLSQPEVEKLYRSVCTRKCHGRDVIERPRTAMEWEMIIRRMRTAERAGTRADITVTEARTITTYLQRHFLSNVPTVLPPKVMRYLKKYLWRIDFGERDIYLDVIYLPIRQRYLASYLAMTTAPLTGDEARFVVYINTHQGVVPQWDLTTMTTLDDGGGAVKPINWEVLYEDDDKHHRQGILTFPPLKVEDGQPATLEMTLTLPEMRKRVFLWQLPVPAMEER